MQQSPSVTLFANFWDSSDAKNFAENEWASGHPQKLNSRALDDLAIHFGLDALKFFSGSGANIVPIIMLEYESAVGTFSNLKGHPWLRLAVLGTVRY